MTSISAVAYGQQEFASIQLGDKNVNNLALIADDAGTIGVLYYKKRMLHAYIIDTRGEVVNKTQMPLKSSPELIGEGFTDSTFHFFFKPKSTSKQGDIGIIELRKDDSQLLAPKSFAVKQSREEEIIGMVPADGDFFVILSNKKKNELRFAKVGPNGITSKTFKYKPPFNPEIFIQTPILFIDPNQNKVIREFQVPVKLYFQNGRFYFTMDLPNQFRTHIWIMDWDRALTRQIQVPNRSVVTGTSSNSFLIDQTLIRLTLEKNMIDLSIYDIGSLELIDQYHYSNQETIGINRGPVYQEDESNGVFRAVEFMSTESLYKSFSKGNASIFAEKIDGDILRVTVGVYNTSSSGLTIGGVFGSFGRSGGVSVSGSKQLTGVQQGSTFFDTILTYPELYMASEVEVVAISDKINNHLGSLNKPPYAIRQYSYGVARHLAYFVRATAQLKIIEFW